MATAQRAAIADVATAFALSRAVIWVAALGVLALFGQDAAQATRLDPLGHTVPFDSGALDTLLAPVARFDAAWLLDVAGSGYDHFGTAAFFPLFPLLAGGLGDAVGSDLLAGLALSVVASLAGLYLIHRLTALDFGEAVARRTVWIMACLPTAFTMSAFYTEGLFLLLSAGSLYAGRLGRWGPAAGAALLAGATRSTGILLVVPLALIYLYGPREDREPDRPAAGWRPRYRLRSGAVALGAAPLGMLAFLVYLGVATGDPLATFAAQDHWARSLAPMAGAVEGVLAAAAGLVDLIAGTHLNAGAVDPRAMGAMNLFLLATLVAVVWLTVEGVRRLPPAYTGYAVVSLALPLSTPAAGQPLMSLPRFAMVVFPLWITLALLAEERDTLRRLLAGSLVLLAVMTGLFVTWIAAP